MRVESRRAASTADFRSGTLRCSVDCSFDTSGCDDFDPSGTYTSTPAPTYQCAFISSLGSYAVDYSIGSFEFTATASSLTVSGPYICDMVGDPVDASTGTFSVCCEHENLCNERYCLSGTYSAADSWSGVFSRTYTPLTAGACQDCVSATESVAGSR